MESLWVNIRFILFSWGNKHFLTEMCSLGINIIRMDVASLNMSSPRFEYIKAYLNSPVVSQLH